MNLPRYLGVHAVHAFVPIVSVTCIRLSLNSWPLPLSYDANR